MTDIQDLLREAVESRMHTRAQHIEDLCRNYIEATGAHPRDLILVERDLGQGTLEWSIRKRGDLDS